MFFDNTDLSSPPVLKAYNMSPLGNPNSSVGYALTEAPLDTSISEAETAVSYLLNETFESSQSESPEPTQQWHQKLSLSPEPEKDPQSDPLQSGSSSSNGLSSSGGDKEDSSQSDPSSLSQSASGTSGSSFTSSSGRPSFYHTSSSFNSSGPSSLGLSRSSASFSSGSFSTSGSSGHSMLMPPFGSSRSDGMVLPHSMSMPSSLINPGKDIGSSTFMNAPQKFMPPGTMSQESSMMEVQMPLMDEDQLAAPLPPSPVQFATGLMQAPSSTPIVNMGRPICTAPNCQCHLAPRPAPPFPTSQPMPVFSMQPLPMKLEPC